MFSNPKYGKNGHKILSREGGKNRSMLMDTDEYLLKAGKTLRFKADGKERAVLLLKGLIRLEYEGKSHTAERRSFTEHGATCLHAARGKEISVTASEDSELIVQAAQNGRDFPTVLYTPDKTDTFISGKGLWGGIAERLVVTIFDYHNAPYSNMVMGEILVPPGHWYSYIPHSHPQPEIYYYRTERPEAFGACFLDEKAHYVKNGSLACIEGGVNHPQVTAPGYPMYVCWMIRHLDGNPWTDRVDDKRYTHLLKNDELQND